MDARLLRGLLVDGLSMKCAGLAVREWTTEHVPSVECSYAWGSDDSMMHCDG